MDGFAPVGPLVTDEVDPSALELETRLNGTVVQSGNIKIIRETEEDAEVVPNLMIGFGIDQIQAEYVADIRLRNINKEYILKRIEETSSLEQEISDLQVLSYCASPICPREL